MSMSIKQIEGIGEKYAERLSTVGIRTVDQLLEQASTAAARMRLADETQLGVEQVTQWTHQADLMRINGVGPEFSELLVRAGVVTVPKLAFRSAESLHEELVRCNDDHGLVRRVPSATELHAMITQAKTLPKIIRH